MENLVIGTQDLVTKDIEKDLLCGILAPQAY